MKLLLLNHSWLAKELTELGHEILTAGSFTSSLDINVQQREITFTVLAQRFPDGFYPDCIIHFDDSGIPWISDLDSLAVRKVFYSVDTHHHFGWHRYYASMFDFVLVAQKNFLEQFNLPQHQVRWFPPWAPTELGPANIKNIDICFRGNLDAKLHPKRAAFFARLSQIIPGDYSSGDYRMAYPQAKIVVNQTVNGDLNFRVFEAMMSGALLLTPDDSPGLLELYRDKFDLLVYPADNADAAGELALWVLNHEKEREQIAYSGYCKTMELHTARSRAKQLDEILRQEQGGYSSPARFYSASMLYLFSYLVAESQGAALMTFLQSSYRNLCVSLEKESVDEEKIIALALHLSAKLAISEESKLVRDMFLQLSKKYPHSLITRIALLDSLLSLGKREEAMQLARTFDQHADALLISVPSLMRQMREDFLKLSSLKSSVPEQSS